MIAGHLHTHRRKTKHLPDIKLYINNRDGFLELHYMAGNLPVQKIKHMPNIPEVVKSEKKMKTMNKGVLASELNRTLRGRGPFTVFVPSDRAFEKLENGAFDELLKAENKIQLTAFLNRHILAHKVHFKNLKEGDKLTTLKGNELTVTIKKGKVCIDGAAIENADIESSNGVIHSLDTVL